MNSGIEAIAVKKCCCLCQHFQNCIGDRTWFTQCSIVDNSAMEEIEETGIIETADQGKSLENIMKRHPRHERVMPQSEACDKFKLLIFLGKGI